MRSFVYILFAILAIACDRSEPKQDAGTMQLVAARVGAHDLTLSVGAENADVPPSDVVVVDFSVPLQMTTAETAIILEADAEAVDVSSAFLNDNKSVSLTAETPFQANKTYTLNITDALMGSGGETFPGFTIDFTIVPEQLEITSITIGGVVVGDERTVDVDAEGAAHITFSAALDPATVISDNIHFLGAGSPGASFSLADGDKTIVATPSTNLNAFSRYVLSVSNKVSGANSEVFGGSSTTFYTAPDPTPKFPVVSDDELLTLVESQTFKYFWDFAEPASGMARERNTSGNLVTSGGSGFGVMAIIVGIERGFITRQEGIDRLDKILDFLETADRFHGAWSHWIDGTTGDVIPFSANDNGGDLVETSFMIQGLLTLRQYLNAGDAQELDLINRINELWEAVEWDWYTQGGQKVLYWHWSPDKGWAINLPIRGYNEALIIYVLAASSTTHTIGTDVYDEGWAKNGAIVNGNSYYSITLPLGQAYGGPLFFAHYSFLGLDPRNLADAYGNYWTQNTNHTLINREHCVVNPADYVGYGEDCWGLTASDNQNGYSAHSPTNDLGVITPTAALSSFPYAPDESMDALKFFYYTIGDKTWGDYGFYDAFNATEGWFGNSYLAIDQGPIIIMIENHRTGLLWDLFMSCPEVQSGLTKLGFSY